MKYWSEFLMCCKKLLSGLSEEWILKNEGENTFSAYNVIGHLLHGEKTDWITRVRMILEKGTSETFDTYDRFDRYDESNGKFLEQLLNEFKAARIKSLDWLKSISLNETMLDLTGMHPKFGVLTLRQLLATRVIHDLTHITQITRVMAKQYKIEMGPWLENFRLMK